MDKLKEQLSKLGLVRSRKFLTGKMMGNKVWLHKSCAKNVLGDMLSMPLPELPFDVIRFDTITKEVVLFDVPGFDLENEPIIKGSWKIEDSVWKYRPEGKNPPIYHHKWMFVLCDDAEGDVYSGFDVASAMSRSVQWKSAMGVDRAVSSRIGRLEYWKQWLSLKNLEL